MPKERYHGWVNLLNRGILATLVVCHCTCNTMTASNKNESIELDSLPVYRFAAVTIKCLKPTSCLKTVRLKAVVKENKDKKVVMHCEVWSDSGKTAQAGVIAIRFYNSDEAISASPFK